MDFIQRYQVYTQPIVAFREDRCEPKAVKQN